MPNIKNNITQKLIQIAFEQKLFEISQLIADNSPTCFVGYCWNKDPRTSAIFQIENHLKSAGIRTLIDHRDGQDSILKHIRRIEAESTDFIIYGMSTLLINKLKSKHENSGVKMEIPKVIERMQIKPNTIIPVLLDGTKFSAIPAQLRDIVYVDFRNAQLYYFSFFQLLKRILSPRDITSIVEEFEQQYESIKKSSMALQSQKLEAIQKLELEDQRLTHEIINETADILLTQTLRKIEAKKNRLDLTNRVGSKLIRTIRLPNPVFLILSFIFLGSAGGWMLLKNHKSLGQVVFNYQTIQTWNIPFPNLYFTGRANELKQIASRFEWHDKRQDPLGIVACVGLGGIGKSELAKHFLVNSRKYSQKAYSFKAWFNAEKLDILISEYRALGQKLGIITTESSPQEIIDKVKTWFENNPDWLVVYNNAENFDALMNFFPKQGGHILINSRHAYWPNPMEIKSMTQEDAISLVKLILQNNIYDNQELKQLVTVLDGLPLAISHAASYILKKKISITSYLEHYNREQKKLLADNTDLPGLHNSSVLVTWDINLKEIQKESSLAYGLLNCLVYLYPDNISCSELPYLMSTNGNETLSTAVDEAVQLLLSYSMISKNNNTNTLDIHRLVQTVMWYKQSIEHSQNKWLSKILKVLINDENDRFILGGLATNKDSIMHIIQHYEETPLEEKTTVLYQSLGCCYLVADNFPKAEENFQAGIHQGGNSAIHCEYGLALYLRKKYQEGIKQLTLSINKANDQLFSYFSEMEKPTVNEIMKEQIDKIGTIRINSAHLAHYLLLKCYLEMKDFQRFNQNLKNFEQIASVSQDSFISLLLNDLQKSYEEILQNQ